MPPFVILHHETPTGGERATHWDLMIEAGGALRTWAIEQPPHVDQTLPATPLADHRLMYLDYEGPLSGERGQVTRWDRGTCAILEETPERLVIALTGQRLCGRLILALATRDE